LSRRTARRQRFYADQRRIRLEPCYLGGGEFDHDWHYVSDWYGDPGVIGGTADCSRHECRACGAEDHESDPPGDEDWDFE
jgi:hypothetical protein